MRDKPSAQNFRKPPPKGPPRRDGSPPRREDSGLRGEASTPRRDQSGSRTDTGPRRDAPPQQRPSSQGPKQQEGRPEPKHGPPDSTFEEVQYLKALAANKTPVRVKLRDNEQVEGVVEYYDASFIRLTRDGEPNLFIYKKDIKYLEE